MCVVLMVFRKTERAMAMMRLSCFEAIGGFENTSSEAVSPGYSLLYNKDPL